LLKDFAASFGNADFVVVPDIYFVRDSEAERANISSKDLVNHISANGGRAVYLGKFGQIVRHLKSKLEPGDLVITMGAGKVWEIADEIVRWLGSDSQA
jgi:UDP-N-acetylmuramate--alanine ligase